MLRDAPATLKSQVWTHFGFYNIGRRKIDKDHTICKNCLVEVKYTGNTMLMQSHSQRNHPDPCLGKAAIVNILSQPAAVDAMFKAKLPFMSLRAARITK